MVAHMKHTKLKKVGFCAGMLLCGVSGYSLMHHVAQNNVSEFNKTEVVIDKDTISIQQFYYNLSYTPQGWVYTTPQGKSFNVDSLCDYHKQEIRRQNLLKNIRLKKQIDTIYVSYDKKLYKKHLEPKIIYKNAYADSLPHMPSMGIYNYDVITIREFKADNSELQKKIDIYNDCYNCTFDHEYSHYFNTINGIRTWNSYSIKFVECCLDEISVNIKQCLSQRRNYITNGRNINFITPRFDFYRKAIENKTINPQTFQPTPNEIKFIANSVFDTWMKDKFDIYVKQECSRSEYFLKDAPYVAILEDTSKHIDVMEKIFTINGIDFWKHISLREKEIFERITPEMQQKWQSLCDNKFQNMSHLEKLEFLKITQGYNKYNMILNKNKIKARILSAFGMDR